MGYHPNPSILQLAFLSLPFCFSHWHPPITCIPSQNILPEADTGQAPSAPRAHSLPWNWAAFSPHGFQAPLWSSAFLSSLSSEIFVLIKALLFSCFLEINSWMVMMFLFTSTSAHLQLIDGIIQKRINVLKGMCVRRRACSMWFKLFTPSQKHSIILNWSGINWSNIAEIPERDYNNFIKHMMAAASVYCCYHKSQMKWFSCMNILHIQYFL